MPALSSTMTEGKIVEWTKSPGERVEKGETVVIVESDKADMDVESFNEGYLAVVLVEAGSSAPVGNAIAYLASTEAEIAEAQKKAASAGGAAAPASKPAAASATAVATSATKETTSQPAVSAANGNGRTVASPRAKKLAKQFSVDLKTLKGSGPYGRIVAADVEGAAGKAATMSKPVAVGSVAASTQSMPAAIAQPQAMPIPVNTMAGETLPLNTLQTVSYTHLTLPTIYSV